MLKLKIQKEPYWLELGSGVRVKVKPCNSAIFYEAKAFMNNKVADMAKKIKEAQDNGIKDASLPDLGNQTKREAYADQQLILGLALAGILEWDGVLEVESEEKSPLTPEKIEELFTNFWLVAENFRQQYCGIQEILEAEKKRLYARAKWHFGDGRSYCKGCGQKETLCPLYKCRYIETALKTVEGYQAWEVLLKLSEPNLSEALKIAEHLGFDMAIMSELLPIGIQGIKCGVDNNNSENSFEKV